MWWRSFTPVRLRMRRSAMVKFEANHRYNPAHGYKDCKLACSKSWRRSLAKHSKKLRLPHKGSWQHKTPSRGWEFFRLMRHSKGLPPLLL